jgi:hypothetical protein
MCAPFKGQYFTSQGVQLNLDSSGTVQKCYKQSVEAGKGSYHLLSNPVLILNLRLTLESPHCHSPITHVSHSSET